MAKTDSRCNRKISPHFLAYLLIFRNTDQQGPVFKKSCSAMSLNLFWKVHMYSFLLLSYLFVCLSGRLYKDMLGDLMAKTDSRCNGKIPPHFLAYLLIFRKTDQQGPAFKKSCSAMSLNPFWKVHMYLFLLSSSLFVCLSGRLYRQMYGDLMAKTDRRCNGKSRVVQICSCPLKLINWWQPQNFLII